MMLEEDKEIVIKGLVETLKERASGYSKARNLVKNDRIKEYLQLLEDQSNFFIGQLTEKSVAIDSTKIHRSTLSLIFRRWMKIHSIFPNKDRAILEDCLLGEETARSAYKAALTEQLPEDLVSTIQEQYEEVRRTLRELEQLKQF